VPAYVVVEIEVLDAARFEDYKRLVAPVIAAYGGRFLSRGGRTDVLEADTTPGRVVILEFPSLERARQWWESDEYAAAKALRLECTRSRIIAVEGV
jgi:uncharacterized protein (DUF1330 family)